jgi:hypothetical protein
MIAGMLFACVPLPAAKGYALQQPAAPESTPETTIRVQTSEVLVPTLVQLPSGEIVYGLGPRDFQLLDNGVQQQLHVDDDLDNEPVSVVVAVEKGRMAALEFDKINRLAPLIDLFLGDGSSEAAFVSFDSKPELVVPFTRDADRLGHALRRLEPGDGGAAYCCWSAKPATMAARMWMRAAWWSKSGSATRWC